MQDMSMDEKKSLEQMWNNFSNFIPGCVVVQQTRTKRHESHCQLLDYESVGPGYSLGIFGIAPMPNKNKRPSL